MHDRDRAPLETRVAVVEDRVNRLETEQQRARDRLHGLETDRATVKMLAGQVSELAKSIDSVATRAAEKAITAALEHRQELSERSWDFRLKLISIGIALGGLTAVLIQHH